MTKRIVKANINELYKKKILTHNVHHDSYYFYTNHISSLNNPLTLFFGISNGEKDNDPEEIDPQMKSFYCFRRCLSYFQSESVAMWKMYADTADEKNELSSKGICFRFTPSIIESFKNRIEAISLVFKKGNQQAFILPDIQQLLAKNVIFTRLQHVVYFQKNSEDDYTLLRSTHKAHVGKDTFDEVCRLTPMKNICWSYETEAKLFCFFSKRLLDKYISVYCSGEKPIGAEIRFKNIGNSNIKIFFHPSSACPDHLASSAPRVSVHDSILKGHVKI